MVPEPRILSHHSPKSAQRFVLELVLRSQKKENLKGDLAAKCYISHICRKAASNAIVTKLGMWGQVPNVIICFSFHPNRFTSFCWATPPNRPPD